MLKFVANMDLEMDLSHFLRSTRNFGGTCVFQVPFKPIILFLRVFSLLCLVVAKKAVRAAFHVVTQVVGVS